MSPQPKLGFLEEGILKILEESGLGELTEENKAKFLPQFVAKAEYNIGLALLPKIKDEFAEEFVTLSSDEDTNADQWREFWTKAVPDYEQVVKESITEFAKQCQELLKK